MSRGVPYTGIVLYPLAVPNGDSTVIDGAAGGQVAGYSYGLNTHATVWSVSSGGNAVDLNPAGFTQSFARFTDGVHQVGSAGSQAFLWSGTAASAVNLHPAVYGSSEAYGSGGNQQVGEGSGGSIGSTNHALLWTGSAASAIDLNPVGYQYSVAMATDGVHQAGYANGQPVNGGTNFGTNLQLTKNPSNPFDVKATDDHDPTPMTSQQQFRAQVLNRRDRATACI